MLDAHFLHLPKLTQAAARFDCDS